MPFVRGATREDQNGTFICIVGQSQRENSVEPGVQKVDLKKEERGA